MTADLRSLAGRLRAIPVRTPVIAGFALVVSLVGLLLVDAAARPLALPLLGTANLLLLYVLVLRDRDGELPVCELGSVCVMITALYGSVPVLGYWLEGLRWSHSSDYRLYGSAMTADVAGIAWRYVIYLASFVVAYLALRGRPASRPASLPAVDAPTESAVVLAIVGISTFFLLVFVRYGTFEDEHSVYAGVAASAVPIWAQLPPLVYFAGRAAVAMLLVAKLCLLVTLFQRWSQLRSRMVLLAWLALEIVHVVWRMGGRRDVAMLLLVAVLLYHRQVRPLAVWQAAVTVSALVAGLLVFGFKRQGWGVQVPWSANNEFQVLFGNAWDLLGRRDRLHVPWQIYLSDLLRLVPPDFRHLLPFEVLDPSHWYLHVVLNGEPRSGLMFGVVAQSILGWDWVELVIRGTVLGLACAAVHRWYARSTGLWATVFYLYLCVWAYYTVRATTFHVVSLVILRLLPSVLVLVPAAFVLGRLRAAPGWAAPPALQGLMARAAASVSSTTAAALTLRSKVPWSGSPSRPWPSDLPSSASSAAGAVFPPPPASVRPPAGLGFRGSDGRTRGSTGWLAGRMRIWSSSVPTIRRDPLPRSFVPGTDSAASGQARSVSRPGKRS